MTNYDVKRYALITAIHAEVIGMVTANQIRFLKNESPAYTQENFQEKAMELENLAHIHDDQL